MTNDGASSNSPGSITVADSHDGRVSTLMIDRAKRLNALTPTMLVELERRVDQIAMSASRVVLIRTAGDRAFFVGADIEMVARLTPTEMWRQWTSLGHRVFNRLASLPQPTIAVVDGLAVGGGLELAMACDLRIADVTARFGQPEIGLGAVPGWAGTERLTRLIGASRAKEMILTRRQIDSTTALNWGLVNSVASISELDEEINRYVRSLLESAPIAQQIAKQLVDAAERGAPSSILEPLGSGFAAYTDDFMEGIRSFRNKTQPRFRGR